MRFLAPDTLGHFLGLVVGLVVLAYLLWRVARDGPATGPAWPPLSRRRILDRWPERTSRPVPTPALTRTPAPRSQRPAACTAPGPAVGPRATVSVPPHRPVHSTAGPEAAPGAPRVPAPGPRPSYRLEHVREEHPQRPVRCQPARQANASGIGQHPVNGPHGYPVLRRQPLLGDASGPVETDPDLHHRRQQPARGGCHVRGRERAPSAWTKRCRRARRRLRV
jgi:hypothetical protein